MTPAAPSRVAVADRRWPRFADPGPLPALLLVLTTMAGVIDAVRILAPGRVFVANTTGIAADSRFSATASTTRRRAAVLAGAVLHTPLAVALGLALGFLSVVVAAATISSRTPAPWHRSGVTP